MFTLYIIFDKLSTNDLLRKKQKVVEVTIPIIVPQVFIFAIKFNISKL